MNLSILCWCFAEGGTPVLFPNTAVKPFMADGSAKRESRSAPTQSAQREKPDVESGFFFCDTPVLFPSVGHIGQLSPSWPMVVLSARVGQARAQSAQREKPDVESGFFFCDTPVLFPSVGHIGQLSPSWPMVVLSARVGQARAQSAQKRKTPSRKVFFV
jgi:hypothetical protein